MIEVKGNLFELLKAPTTDAIVITTNANYTKDGRACMSGGGAKQCADLYSKTSYCFAKCLKNFGANVPFVIGALNDQYKYEEPNLRLIKARKYKCLIFSFPTINDL